MIHAHCKRRLSYGTPSLVLWSFFWTTPHTVCLTHSTLLLSQSRPYECILHDNHDEACHVSWWRTLTHPTAATQASSNVSGEASASFYGLPFPDAGLPFFARIPKSCLLLTGYLGIWRRSSYTQSALASSFLREKSTLLYCVLYFLR